MSLSAGFNILSSLIDYYEADNHRFYTTHGEKYGRR